MQPAEYAAHAALEDAHWWFRARRNIIAAALERCAPEARKHLLEIGCGTGGNLRFFKARFAEVTGIDAAPAAIMYARERVPGETRCGDFRTQLAHDWNRYDVVLLADVLEHIEDDRTFLRDVIARMAPGSHLLITVPAHPWLYSAHDRTIGHFRRYTSATLRRLYADQPVRELYFTPFNAWLLPVVAAARLLQTRANSEGHSDLKAHGALTNAVLYGIFTSEAAFVRHARLPWGCSLMAVLRKA